MKSLALPALISAALLTCACTDPTMENPPAPPPAAPPEAAAVIAMDASTPPGVSVTAPDGTTPVSAPQGQPDNAFPEAFATEQTLHTLNMFLIEYQATGAAIPPTIEEMVAKKIIPKIPPPPAGKRFEVDTQKAMVSFVDSQ